MTLLLCLTSLLLLSASRAVQAEGNLLLNGDLGEGSREEPSHWQAGGWLTGPEVTIYGWNHGADGSEVAISNLKPNDARWMQSLHLGPGWYHFTASIRTQDVGQSNTGATLSLLEDGIISEQIHGTSNWRRVGLFLKVGHSGADVIVACRLGGYGSLNTGKAFYRKLRADAEAPVSSEDPQYDLDIIRTLSAPPENPYGAAPVIAILVFSALLLIGLFGWRKFTKDKTWPQRKTLSTLTLKPIHLQPTDHARQRVEIILFLLTAMTFAYFYQASDHSTASRIDLIRAMLERHTLWIENPYAGYNTADIVELHSHIYSNKAPGGAFTGLLPWAIVTTVLRTLIAPNGGLYWAFATYLTTVFTVSFLVALLTVLVYRSALHLGASDGRALAVALTLGFGTIMFPYATEFTAEPIAAFCIFSAFYLLIATDKETPLPGKYLCAGFLAGWSVLCDYPTFLLAAGIGAYALWKLRKMRLILAFAAGASFPAFLLGLYNQIAFGHPFFLSYEAYMLPGSDRFPEQAAGFAGVTYPRLSVLWDVLFGAQRGLVFCNPVLLLMVPGLIFFWRLRRHRAEWLLITYSILSFILFNGSYGESIIYWGGGTATGPRHIVSALPFMVLTLAFLPEAFNYMFVLLALWSAFLMLMVTAVEPHLPYEYENPLRDFIWPAYLRADLGYNKSTYFGGPPIAGDSVAFNLGKLIGLPGTLQLLPLAAMWLVGAREFLNSLKLWEDVKSCRRALVAAGLAIAALFAPTTIGSILANSNMNEPHGLLARYYEGLRPNGFSPHIVRVDRQIDFNSVVELGALPPPSSVVWKGKLLISVEGLYRFIILADDNGWLKIDGHWIIADAGETTKLRSEGSIQLTGGVHSIEVGERNVWDGASMRLIWQPPGMAEEVMPSRVFIPDHADGLLTDPEAKIIQAVKAVCGMVKRSFGGGS